MTSDTLRRKRCLLTGATGGMGRALAAELSRAGVQMFLSARDTIALGELANTIGGGTGFAACDLRSEADVVVLAGKARASLGGVDVLINNAGVFPVRALANTSNADLETCLAVNVKAPYILCRELAPHMSEAGWGRIVNIASSSAYAGFRNTTAYCASKHALLGLSRALNDELKDGGVRTYVISPGSIRTTMALAQGQQDPATFLDPQEVAAFIVDLISQDGTMITEEVRLNRVTIR